MILRDIITTVEYGSWHMLKLECGHESGPVSERRLPKRRKRCHDCELIADHRARSPGDHHMLLNFLHQVPMDDRAETMVQWINHLHRSLDMTIKGNGLCCLAALALTQQPTTYPLVQFFDGGDADV